MSPYSDELIAAQREIDKQKSRADTLTGLLADAREIINEHTPGYTVILARIDAALSDGDGERGGGG